jgi:hypothetical protein
MTMGFALLNPSYDSAVLRRRRVLIVLAAAIGFLWEHQCHGG